jgi:hypothetical protein
VNRNREAPPAERPSDETGEAGVVDWLAVGDVIGSAEGGRALGSLDHPPGEVANVDDAQLLAGDRDGPDAEVDQAEDGERVAVARAVDRRRPDDGDRQSVPIARGDVLGGELAPAVGGDRPRRVILVVRAARPGWPERREAGEDEDPAEAPGAEAGFEEIGRAVGVDAEVLGRVERLVSPATW